ncbi:MFS transporter [Mycobacterium sp.]|uniref:MFS transporter n=1 Tax=Mycobacterium sp. TaxID=1785 RepID=UPI002D672F8B|nr:MFS transporter [Mycobacterium sp.]HZA08678.1 MFS transporter [Mycobacterium sp.]
MTLARTAGGPERLKPILLLALVVGLQSADNGTVGALVVPLKRSLHIDNTQVGLLVTLSTGIGALATLLAGALADRTIRVRLLWITLLVCSAAMALSAASPSYGWLLVCRVALGAGVAVSGPVVASLVGDFFAPGERGRVYGLVLAGEGACTAMGLLVAGELAAVNWRLGFWWLAVVGLILAVGVATMLREPPRGGRSRLAAEAGGITSAANPDNLPMSIAARDGGAAQQHASVILDKNAQGLSPWQAVRYVLSIRTNIVLVVGSSFGYFFFTGLSTFGVALLRGRFQIGQSVATLLIVVLGVGALIGVLSTGRIADWLMTRGHIGARMVVGGAAFLAAAIFILPTLLTHSLLVAIVFAFLAAIGLGGVNPPLDAARLDIVHSRLWGTAEAVRTTLVSISTGLAPLVFGVVSTNLGGSQADLSSAGEGQGGLSGAGGVGPSAATALNHTFLIMLVTLVIAAALILSVARRTYPRDVATAIASESATAAVVPREPTDPRAGTGLQILQHQ